MINNRKNPDIRTISNISITNECYKKVKMMSIDRETSIQEIISELIEKVISKKNVGIQQLDDLIKSS